MVERGTIKASTKQQYLQKYQLLQKTGLHPISNPGATVAHILSKYKTNRSRKTHIAAILGLHRAKEIELSESARASYIRALNELDEKITREVERQELTEKQKSNWLTDSQIRAIGTGLRKPFLKMTPTMDHLWDLQKYIVYSLYTKRPPIRNNYYSVVVKPHHGDNTYDLHTGLFEFKNHKVVKSHGIFTFTIHDAPLKQLIRLMMSWRQQLNLTDPHLLVGKRGKAFNTSRMTHLLNEIFGKGVSSTQLRTMLISKQLKPTKSNTVESRKRLASQMNHSSNVQTHYAKRMK